MATLDELARQLNTGSLRVRDLVDAALDRIADPAGEGARAFITVNADSAPPAMACPHSPAFRSRSQ